MSNIAFGITARKRSGCVSAGPVSSEPAPDKSLDAVWVVLEAANDLGDHPTVEVCRRVIDANLNGRPASPFDLHIILEYFS
jgi:hypothetical protein